MRVFWYGNKTSSDLHMRNWGDIITPVLINKIANITELERKLGPGKHLVVGSIMHRLSAGDTVWGTGAVSPKHIPKPLPRKVDFRAVRGPLTRKALIAMGADVPEIYGDPALLTSYLFKSKDSKIKHKIGIIPHYVDLPKMIPLLKKLADDPSSLVIDVCGGIGPVIEAVCSCERIVSSSLHGLVLGDAYGKRVAWLQVDGGTGLVGRDFKFEDYLASTGREPIKSKYTSGGTLLDINWLPPAVIDLVPLLRACPFNHEGYSEPSSLPLAYLYKDE